MYIPDIDSWEEWQPAEQAFRDHQTSVVDATFYDLEVEGSLLSRDFKTIPHPFVVDTIRRFQHVISPDCRIVLTHLNHSNPICNPQSPEAKATKQHGFLIAKEGDTYSC